jgi:hypothetical protein
MWHQGKLPADTIYFDPSRSEWFPLQEIAEDRVALFTSEEAFVRVGQARLKGCLHIYNREYSAHLFLDNGFIVSAISDEETGELVLLHALHLHASLFEWFPDEESPSSNLSINVAEYAMRHSLARDIKIGLPPNPASNTVSLGEISRKILLPKEQYFLVAEHDTKMKLPVLKTINILGRDVQCDIQIESLKISRRHCMIELAEQNLKVTDLDSSNGTFINGALIHNGILNPGDQLRVGSYCFKLARA